MIPAEAGPFKGTAGLQLYSLREEFKNQGVAATLDQVKGMGFKEVELAGTYGLDPQEFKKMLAERGLTAVSGHIGYEQFAKDPAAAVQQAKALGVKYIGCAWIPHTEAQFSEDDVKKAAANFNAWGEALKKEGIQFFYHCHGYEFKPHGDGTLMDLLIQSTNPETVVFEMDVFWVVQPGADPAKYLSKYPKRWALMHLKDIRKGARTGVFTGRAPKTDDVPLGTGMVDWPKVLQAAAESGVTQYFIEDEAPTAATAIPESLKYLATLQAK